MITKTKSYQTSDGKIFSSIPEAQEHELCIILQEIPCMVGEEDQTRKATVAKHILKNADKVADILTTKGSSKPAARSVNGGTKKRTPKATQAAPTKTPEAQ